MADVSSTLKLENGKRYRWVHEGVWESRTKTWDEVHGPALAVPLEEYVSIEPLPDPEPEWKHGAVVRAGAYSTYPFVYDRDNSVWRTPSDGYGNDSYSRVISEAWKAGTLEILYTPED